MSVQATRKNTSNSSSNSSSSNSNIQITTDFDIFGVDDSINTSNYVYDGQTILLVNSSASQNSSTVKGTYFDPTQSTSYSWTMTANSNLSSSFASQALLDTNTNIMQNFIPDGTSMPQYTIDLLNASNTVTLSNNTGPISITDVSSGIATDYYNYNLNTTTMALLGTNTYTSTTGTGIAPTDTNPNYNDCGSSSYMFTGNYYYPQTGDIIIIYMIYTINGTALLNSSTGSSSTNSSSPTVTASIYNRVISREAMSKGNTTGKMYTAGPINLSYTVPGVSFDGSSSSYGINYNIPVLIADNCTKIYATLALVYVPPSSSNTGQYFNYGNLLNDNVNVPGFFIGTTSSSSTSNCVVVNENNISAVSNTNLVTNGHFVVCLAYSSGVSTNYAGVNSYCNLLLKNIWRSPISVYNTYSSYSVSDMATKQVVVLFGKSSSGATFLVTNSGTPISNITNYSVTSLSNFIGLMSSVISLFDSTSSLVSFFTDKSIVETNNFTLNTNNVALTLQPLLNGTVVNPISVSKSPNMWYMLLQTNNSANMSIDPTSQDLFNNDIGNYFDLQNSSLCATGKVNYSNSILSILTAGGSYLFGNSIYSGQTTINNQNFYNLIVLPEAQFSGAPTSNAGNLSVYAVSNSPFYTSTSSTSTSSTRLSSSSSTSKLKMSVSNIDIL